MPNGEPDLDRVAQQVHNLFMFKNFNDHMNFDTGQRMAVKKAISKLIDSSRDSGLV